jgi:hypothetical protein
MAASNIKAAIDRDLEPEAGPGAKVQQSYATRRAVIGRQKAHAGNL